MSVIEVTTGDNYYGGSAQLFKNIESFPGQLMITPSTMSARQEEKITRKDAVRGARQVERTNEHVRGGIDRKVNMVVGAKLRIKATPQAELLAMEAGWTPEYAMTWKKTWARQCEAVFHDWAYSKRCVQDAERHYNFGGLMWLAYRGLTGPDAAFCGFIGYDEARAAKYKSRWATYLALIDPDRIATPPEMIDPEEKHIFEGRRIDDLGAMEGFWITRGHPSEGGLAATEYQYIPRETDWGRPFGFHWFMKYRPGAQHGLTTLLTSLRHSTMLDRFDDARLGAAILQELFAVYAHSDADADAVAASLAPMNGGSSIFEKKLDFYNEAKIRFGTARVGVLPTGDKLEMLAASRSGVDPTAFVNSFLRKLAMTLDLPFEQFANDYSQANYSSIRASLLDAWRGVVAQRHLFGQQLPANCFDAIVEEALFRGRLILPPNAPPFSEFRDAYTSCEVTGPGMGWVDPKKEMEAFEIAVRNRFTSRKRIAAQNGDDVLEIFDEIAAEEEEAESRGIDLEPVAPAMASASDGTDDDEDEDEDRPRPLPASQEQ